MNSYKTKLVNEIKNYLTHKEEATARQITNHLNNKEDLNINNGVTVLEIANLMKRVDCIKKNKRRINYYYIDDDTDD